MDEMFRALAVCVGVPTWIGLLVFCIILWTKFSKLRQRVQLLEARLGDTARDWWTWANGMSAFVKTLAPAPGASTGVATVPESSPSSPRAAEPKAPAITIEFRPPEAAHRPAPARPATPPAEIAPEDRLKNRIEELRHKPVVPPMEKAAVTPVAATPTVAAAPPPEPKLAPATASHTTAPSVAAAVPPSGAPPTSSATPAPRPAPVPRKAGLEAYLGMKLFVVIGAIALALAGIFLVKIGIDRGVFDAKVRDIATLSAGVLFIAVGQWRRRHEGFWSQGATGAGIIALFAGFFAATSIHHFLSQPIGFVAMAISTAVAVVFSLQDWSGGRGGKKGGALIATLGLIGGYMTPILIHSETGNVPGLFGYLILLHVGIVASTRMRGWSILAALAVLFSSAWLIGWLVFMPFHPEHAAIYGVFLVTMVFSLAISTVGEPERWNSHHLNLASNLLTWLAMGMGLLAGCVLLGKSNFIDMEWAFFAVLLAGAFFLGRLRSMYEGLTWMSCTAVAVMLFVWAGPHHQNFSEPGDVQRLIGWLSGFGLASVLAAYGCSWKSALPARWTLLSVLMGMLYVGLAYFTIPSLPRADEWAWLALGAAGLFVALAVPVYLKRHTIVTGELCLAFLAHAVLLFLYVAAPMAHFENGALTALWAGLLVLVALGAWRLRIPSLLIGFLMVGFILAARGAMFGDVLHLQDGGYALFWNPIVWTYGSLLGAFALSARIIERMPDHPDGLLGVIPSPETISALLQVAATAAGFFLLTFLVALVLP